MHRRRPCRICRKWFRPHPRAGARQRVCSSRACQRERHRQACEAWHARNPGYDRESRLQKKLHLLPKAAAPPSWTPAPIRPPTARLDWDAARDAVGPEVTVVVEESLKVTQAWVRDVVTAQPTSRQKVTPGHGPSDARDEIAIRAAQSDAGTIEGPAGRR